MMAERGSLERARTNERKASVSPSMSRKGSEDRQPLLTERRPSQQNVGTRLGYRERKSSQPYDSLSNSGIDTGDEVLNLLQRVKSRDRDTPVIATKDVSTLSKSPPLGPTSPPPRLSSLSPPPASSSRWISLSPPPIPGNKPILERPVVRSPSKRAQRRTIILITGADTGVGEETVKALLESPQSYHILLAGRDLPKTTAAAQRASVHQESQASPPTAPSTRRTIEPLLLDVESDASIFTAFETVSAKVDHIDVLINNAEASFDSLIYDRQLMPREAWNKAWNINVTGAQIVTETFLPLLLRSAEPRLLFNTSALSSLSDSSNPDSTYYRYVPAGLPKTNDLRGAMGYRCSKAGSNMLMVEWTRMLSEDSVKVFGIATDIGGNTEKEIGGSVVKSVVEGKYDNYAGRIVSEFGDDLVQKW